MNGSTDARQEFDASTTDEAARLIEHLNDHHADTVLLVARHLEPTLARGELAAVDPGGVDFSGVLEDGTATTARLEFPDRVFESHEVQGHLLAAVHAARAAAPPDLPLTSLEAELAATTALPTVHGVVVGTRRLTPSLIEVTVGGLVDYPLTGGDDFIYVMVSSDPAGIDPAYSMSDFRERSEGDPVVGAYYTARRFRPDVGEVDLWVVEHDHPGSVAEWMMSATAGSRIAFWGPRKGIRVPDGAEDVLLVADETGLAAVATTIETAADDLSILAVLETTGPEHRPVMPTHPNLRIVWVDRGDDAPGVVNHLLAAVQAEVSTAPAAAFGAADSRQVSAIRRHLRGQLGMPAGRVTMTGYWRRGD